MLCRFFLGHIPFRETTVLRKPVGENAPASLVLMQNQHEAGAKINQARSQALINGSALPFLIRVSESLGVHHARYLLAFVVDADEHFQIGT